MKSADWNFLLELAVELGQMPADRQRRWGHYTLRMTRRLHGLQGVFGLKSHTDRIVPAALFGPDEDSYDAFLDSRVDNCTNKTCGYDRSLREATDLPALSGYRHVTHPFGLPSAARLAWTTGQGKVIELTIAREKGSKGLNRRELELVAFSFDQIRPLLLLDKPASPLARLPRKLRGVAERLLAGDSHKQAAHHLGLSYHTVTQYTKLLHRELGVSSRSELMLALMRRE